MHVATVIILTDDETVTIMQIVSQSWAWCIFSERELTFAIMSSSVRLSSVTFVHLTQAIEIFGNISMTFGTLAIHDLSVKILRRASQGNPFVGGVKHQRGSRI